MRIRIIENTDGEGDRGHSRSQLEIAVSPKGDSTIEDMENALRDRNNYGSYLINIRDKREVERAIEDYFGPSHPLKRKKAQAERGGEPFPIKTKQAMDDLIKNLGGDNPKLLNWEKKDNYLIFPSSKNISQLRTQNIVKQVFDTAGIKYKMEKIEGNKVGNLSWS
jgi:hypothetical protein